MKSNEHLLGVVDLEIVRIVFILSDERLLESVHFRGFAVDENDVGRFKSLDELGRLLVIRVGGERDVLHGAIEF